MYEEKYIQRKKRGSLYIVHIAFGLFGWHFLSRSSKKNRWNSIGISSEIFTKIHKIQNSYAKCSVLFLYILERCLYDFIRYNRHDIPQWIVFLWKRETSHKCTVPDLYHSNGAYIISIREYAFNNFNNLFIQNTVILKHSNLQWSSFVKSFENDIFFRVCFVSLQILEILMKKKKMSKKTINNNE